MVGVGLHAGFRLALVCMQDLEQTDLMLGSVVVALLLAVIFSGIVWNIV